APDVEERVARLELRPIDVVGVGDRTRRPPVIAAARYAGLGVYFHDDRTYVERAGFWTRGRSRVDLSLVRGTASEPPASGVRFRLQGSARDATPLTLATPAWRTRVTLPPGETMEITVPWRTEVAVLPVAITVDTGFVPAETGGDPGDQRVLGCFV